MMKMKTKEMKTRKIFFSIMPIYISQTEIYINALKRKKTYKYNATKEHNLLHTGLNTEKSHSTLSFKCCTHMHILFKRYLLIQCSFLYKMSKERANETYKSFQKIVDFNISLFALKLKCSNP